MEKEKKGLFGRLLDFWREKIGMGETDSIGFWNEKDTLEKHFAEMGTVETLRQQEVKKNFWEEKVDRVLEEKEQEGSVLVKQKKIFLTETEEKEKNPRVSEEPEDTERKQRAKLFTAEIFREERQAETEEGSLGRTFLWEMPAEEREKRSIIPVMAEPVQEKESVAEELQEMPKREIPKKEEPQAEPVMDIEKLMRQMTKKLWEERESCGRRLR